MLTGALSSASEVGKFEWHLGFMLVLQPSIANFSPSCDWTGDDYTGIKKGTIPKETPSIFKTWGCLWLNLTTGLLRVGFPTLAGIGFLCLHHYSMRNALMPHKGGSQQCQIKVKINWLKLLLRFQAPDVYTFASTLSWHFSESFHASGNFVNSIKKTEFSNPWSLIASISIQNPSSL